MGLEGGCVLVEDEKVVWVDEEGGKGVTKGLGFVGIGIEWSCG